MRRSSPVFSLILFLFFSGASFAQMARPAASTAEESTSTPASQQTQTLPLQESPFLSSVTTEKATSEPITLTLREAIDRGLKNNLGLILSTQGGETARAARLRSLSNLLPHVNAHLTENVQQINLAAFGLSLPGFPSIVGPFSLFDARATASQPILDLKVVNDLRTSKENVRAAQFNYNDARELVVLVVANEYLQALAEQARVDAAQAQLETAQTIFDQTSDLKKNGVAAGIDVLRAQVQLQTRQQRLIAAKNDFEKQKLALIRTIGLPPAQAIVLGDRMPEAPAPPVTLEIALEQAKQQRSDLQRAQSLLRAAELNKRAQESQYLPSLHIDGDYGTIGRTAGNSHGTFTAAATLQVPIFQGGRNRAEVRQAEVEIEQRKAELSDTEARVDAEVRRAFMDVESATAQVQVAKSAVDLAGQQLTQARDRFTSGVSGSLEVVESEQAVTEANENLISALYASNVAKATLARATGRAEQLVKEFLGAK